MTKVYMMDQLQNAALNLNALYSDTLHAAINDDIETYLLATEELLTEKQIVKAPTKISEKIVYTTTENFFSTADRDRMEQIIQLLTQRPETAGFIMQQLTGPGTMPYICRLLDQLEEEQRIVGFTDHDNEFRYQLRSRVIFNETPVLAPDTNPAHEASTETKSPLDILTEKITDTLATTPGMTADELAEKLSDDRTNILAALLCLETEGQTKQHTTDKKRFYLSGQDTPPAPAPQDTTGTISNLEHYRRIKQDRSAKKPTNRTKTRNDGQLSLFG